jgi:DNA modification methylase
MIKLIHDDCIKAMQQLGEGSIDLTVTSPPYDNLRTYEGSLEWNEDIWKQVLDGLYRVTKDGGVVVWVVGDATVKGSETGTSFKQALYAKEIGFNLHDTMIWNKGNPVPNDRIGIGNLWNICSFCLLESQVVAIISENRASVLGKVRLVVVLREKQTDREGVT